MRELCKVSIKRPRNEFQPTVSPKKQRIIGPTDTYHQGYVKTQSESGERMDAYVFDMDGTHLVLNVVGSKSLEAKGAEKGMCHNVVSWTVKG